MKTPENKKQLLIVKPNTISSKDKEKLSKNGYLLIEHPFPGDVRVISALDVDGSILLSAAMGTIVANGTDTVKAGFFNRVYKQLYPEPKTADGK